ncbi:MAG TPA: GreA/GreB family elongation factor [Burkholderiales bacterium]
MDSYNELLVSARDAEILALVVGQRRRRSADADAANALADVLMEARLVPHERLPADRVAIDSRVTYEEQPAGTFRTVVVVHPAEANAAAGRVSVLSPIGRALLGRQPGVTIDAGAPMGRELRIRIVSADKPS